ncbi:MAG: hypothetical protein DKM50_04755 [Candidatus Margulisiibacteriota bacterium]|nr:MAG: hypothetical protein DKM50_04755 [Candidatus Margulisiibacteriota bacterium]
MQINDLKDKVTIGIIGAGAIVDMMHLPVLVNMKEISIKWICDKNIEKAIHLANKFSIEKSTSIIEECADVDIVLIAIPVGYRKEVFEYVCNRGWNVLVEKPLAINYEEHKYFSVLMREKKVLVSVGLMRRFYRNVLFMKFIIDSNIYGSLCRVKASEGAKMRGSQRGGDWYFSDRNASGGGVLIETGSHLVDQVLYITNANSFELIDYKQSVFGEIEYEAIASSYLIAGKQEKQIKFDLIISKLQDVYPGIVFSFDKAKIHLQLSPSDFVDVYSNDNVQIGRLTNNNIDGAVNSYQAFYLEWRDFVKSFHSSTKSVLDIDSCLLSTKFIDDCYSFKGVNL